MIMKYKLLNQKNKCTRLNKIFFHIVKDISVSYLYFDYILLYINSRDLRSNQLNGSIPQSRLSENITTM
jgi:hypothetical protein